MQVRLIFDDFNWDIFFGKILFFMAGQYVGENVYLLDIACSDNGSWWFMEI